MTFVRRLALIALIPGAYLAWWPTSVHYSWVDPSHPVYASNYLAAHGFVVWLVTEVPLGFADTSLQSRLSVPRLFANYLIGLLIVTAAYQLWRTVRSWKLRADG